MERIGLAASKMAKGNLLLYNFFIIVLTIIFSLFIFFIAGSSITLALVILAYFVNGIMPTEFNKQWWDIFRICMVTLTMVVSIFSLCAILKNIRIYQSKD